MRNVLDFSLSCIGLLVLSPISLEYGQTYCQICNQHYSKQTNLLDSYHLNCYTSEKER